MFIPGRVTGRVTLFYNIQKKSKESKKIWIPFWFMMNFPRLWLAHIEASSSKQQQFSPINPDDCWILWLRVEAGHWLLQKPLRSPAIFPLVWTAGGRHWCVCFIQHLKNIKITKHIYTHGHLGKCGRKKRTRSASVLLAIIDSIPFNLCDFDYFKYPTAEKTWSGKVRRIFIYIAGLSLKRPICCTYLGQFFL